jgi:hypothetical protein
VPQLGHGIPSALVAQAWQGHLRAPRCSAGQEPSEAAQQAMMARIPEW